MSNISIKLDIEQAMSVLNNAESTVPETVIRINEASESLSKMSEEVQAPNSSGSKSYLRVLYETYSARLEQFYFAYNALCNFYNKLNKDVGELQSITSGDGSTNSSYGSNSSSDYSLIKTSTYGTSGPHVEAYFGSNSSYGSNSSDRQNYYTHKTDDEKITEKVLSGQEIDLSSIEKGLYTSESKEELNLITDAGKNVHFLREVVNSDGETMWAFEQENGLGYAWFKKDDVLEALKNSPDKEITEETLKLVTPYSSYGSTAEIYSKYSDEMKIRAEQQKAKVEENRLRADIKKENPQQGGMPTTDYEKWIDSKMSDTSKVQEVEETSYPSYGSTAEIYSKYSDEMKIRAEQQKAKVEENRLRADIKKENPQQGGMPTTDYEKWIDSKMSDTSKVQEVEETSYPSYGSTAEIYSNYSDEMKVRAEQQKAIVEENRLRADIKKENPQQGGIPTTDYEKRINSLVEENRLRAEIKEANPQQGGIPTTDYEKRINSLFDEKLANNKEPHVNPTTGEVLLKDTVVDV